MGCCESKANVETNHQFEILSGRPMDANASDAPNQST